MVNKNDFVESKITEYYYHVAEIKAIDTKIFEINHEMEGIRSPRFDSIPTISGEDRQHKLIRLGEKLSEYEKKKNESQTNCILIYNSLNLAALEELELKLIEYIYYHKYTYDKIAKTIGYTDKSYVSRKKDSILNKIAANMLYL